MSGGTKQQFKQFSITCAEDACLVLGMLISGMTVNLEKYKEYASEAESLLESTQEEYVPAKEYDDVNQTQFVCGGRRFCRKYSRCGGLHCLRICRQFLPRL